MAQKHNQTYRQQTLRRLDAVNRHVAGCSARFFLCLLSVLVVAGTVSGCGISGTSSYTSPGTVPPTSFSAASTQAWLRQFGTGIVLPPLKGSIPLPADTPTGVAVDAEGNTVVAGYTYGAFPGYTNQAAVAEGFLAKFDSGGKQIWLQQFQQPEAIGCNGVAIDAQGNILTVVLQSISTTGNKEGTAVDKFDASGNLVWTQPVPLNYIFDGANIAVDGQGNVAVVVSQLDAALSANQFSSSVLKLDGSTGLMLWQQEFIGATSNGLGGIATDSQGNVLLVGIAIGSYPIPIPAVQTQVTKLAAANGQEIWTLQQYGQTPSFVGAFLSVAVDRQDNVLVGGTSSGALNQGVLAKYRGDTGSTIWLQQFSAPGGSLVTSVDADPEGNAIVAGTTYGSFAPQFTLPAQNNYVGKFTPGGQNIWVQQFGTGPLTNVLTGTLSQPFVASDASGNILVAGSTTGTYPGFSNPKHAAEVYLKKFKP